ncbi:MAG: LptA/OstA family protein [Pseudomonadota bacterium]|jgi:lipopolysaccharide export system protein LptA
MTPKSRLAVLALCAGMATAAAATLQAQAQDAKPAAGGGVGLSSSGGPIDISADEQEVFQQEHRIIWKGNVDAVQDKARLKTPRLEVFYVGKTAAGAQPAADATSPAGGSKIERMEADGPVYYSTDTESARGDHGTYLASNDTITLFGNVVVMQGQNVAKGDKLVIEQKTGHSVLSVNNKGPGGKVRGVFYPNQKTSEAGAATAPAKPAERH